MASCTHKFRVRNILTKTHVLLEVIEEMLLQQDVVKGMKRIVGLRPKFWKCQQ